MNSVFKQIDVEVLESIKKELKNALEPMVPYKIDPLEFCREAHTVKDNHIKNVLAMLGLSDKYAILNKNNPFSGLDADFLFNLDSDRWSLYDTHKEASSVADGLGLIDSIEIVNVNR